MTKSSFALSPRAVIRDASGRMLLLRRSRENGLWPGEWDLPGGKPLVGESVEDCLEREVLEETGMVIETLRLLHAADWPMRGIRVIFLVMEAKWTGGELRLSDEHDSHRWVGASGLDDHPLIPPLQASIGAMQKRQG